MSNAAGNSPPAPDQETRMHNLAYAEDPAYQAARLLMLRIYDLTGRGTTLAAERLRRAALVLPMRLRPTISEQAGSEVAGHRALENLSQQLEVAEDEGLITEDSALRLRELRDSVAKAL